MHWRRAHDIDSRARHLGALAAVAKAFAERILPIDKSVADEWGRMSSNRPVPTINALLAATAKVHAITLVSRNVADVADLGASVLNPFDVRMR